MTQRFNPPPGWQVPEAFVPPTGWQPDPSWPPAPDGWNYWVDDGAPSQAPRAAPAAPVAGQPAAGGYGAQGGYGADPSQAPGSANIALAQKQVKDNKRLMYLGFGVAVAGIVVWLISFGIAASSPTSGSYIRPWYICLIGIALGIRGAVATSKAKKAAAQMSGGMAGAYGNGPANSAPMPPTGPGIQPAGPWPQQDPGAEPAPPASDRGTQQQKNREKGSNPLGGLYR